ncbi:hypothetical protein AAVH_12036 [Aphelenchoides avenae]|nr:hypothetical protein AAVH_35897 [Aphelenchus avenae]KAH7720503.1 hypothetical protein AAVH_12036 [Aphelenchus avenae]
MFEPSMDPLPDVKEQEQSNQDDNYEAPASSAATAPVSNTPNPGTAALELLPDADKQFLLTYPVNKKCFCGTDGMFYEAKIKKYYTAGGQLLLLVHFEGWNARYDETLSLVDARDRLLPYDKATMEALEESGKLASKEVNKLFEVEQILGVRRDRKGHGREFYIKWHGYDDNSWEPERNIRHTSVYEEWKKEHDKPPAKTTKATSQSPTRSLRSNTPRNRGSTPGSRTSTPQSRQGASPQKRVPVWRLRDSARQSMTPASVRRSGRAKRAARYDVDSDDTFDAGLDERPSGSGLQRASKASSHRGRQPPKKAKIAAPSEGPVDAEFDEEERFEILQDASDKAESPMSHASTTEVDEDRRAQAEVEEEDEARDVMTLSVGITELTPEVEAWIESVQTIPGVHIISLINHGAASQQ